MANGRDSDLDLAKAMEKLMDAEMPSDDEVTTEQLAKAHRVLRQLVIGSVASLSKQVNRLRKLLPWKPWMAQLFGPVTIGGIVVVAVWLVTAGRAAKANEARLAQHDAKFDSIGVIVENRCDKVEEEMKPLRDGVVEANASLRMLLQSRGLRGPGAHELRAARQRLGFRDSADQDSLTGHDDP